MVIERPKEVQWTQSRRRPECRKSLQGWFPCCPPQTAWGLQAPLNQVWVNAKPGLTKAHGGKLLGWVQGKARLLLEPIKSQITEILFGLCWYFKTIFKTFYRCDFKGHTPCVSPKLTHFVSECKHIKVTSVLSLSYSVRAHIISVSWSLLSPVYQWCENRRIWGMCPMWRWQGQAWTWVLWSHTVNSCHSFHQPIPCALTLHTH